ncbi:MAG: hypothetical protein AAB876_02285 [Patescibacteria group bacterium]
MKDKLLMTSFFGAHLGDVASTLYALNNLNEFKEVGLIGSSAFESGKFINAIVFRTLIMGYLLAGFALSKKNDSNLSFSYEKALKIGNFYSWAVLGINLVQIVPSIVNSLHK